MIHFLRLLMDNLQTIQRIWPIANPVDVNQHTGQVLQRFVLVYDTHQLNLKSEILASQWMITV